ncbi:hypothetical protein MP228_003678 [Amoeboaphelidium protococcarum]|nr:hypothetical protein MP228_003678 [Amoeboaphelidium protococcarum]
MQRTLALIKPHVVADKKAVEYIFKTIKSNDKKFNKVGAFDIERQQTMTWNKSEASQFYKEHQGKEFYPRLIEYMTSGPFIAMILVAPDAVNRWRIFIGHSDPIKAKLQDPMSLRARYALSQTRNGFHGSDSSESARKEIEMVFRQSK